MLRPSIAIALLTALPLAAQMTWVPEPVTGSPPNPRAQVVAVQDTLRQRLVVFGGLQLVPGTQFQDTWEWDGTRWRRVATTGPTLRSAYAAAFDAARGRVVLFGGFSSALSGQRFADTWEWDGASWQQRNVTGPPGRTAAAMAYDARRQRIVMFGGTGAAGANLDDVWEWDGTSWTQRTNGYANGAPVARTSATLSWAPPLGGCVLVGGSSPARGVRGDAWLWDGIGWRSLGFGPAVMDHGAAWDEARGRLVVHGGYDGRDESPETWEWDGSTWLPQPPALPVAGHTLVYDPRLGRVLRFGGFQNPGGVVSDLSGLRQTVADQVVTAGAACSASNPPPNLATTSRPLLGASGFALLVTRAGPLLPVIAVLSPSQGNGQVFGSCTVVPDLANAALLFGLSDLSGSAALALPIPFDAALRGATLFHQTVVLVPGGPLNGVGALSNALATTLGD